MKNYYHPSREDISLTSVLYALSDPIRLGVVKQLLKNGEMSCGEFGYPVAKSTISHHARTLREAGVVYNRPQGTQRLLTVREEDLEARFPGLLKAIIDGAEATGAGEEPAKSDPEEK